MNFDSPESAVKYAHETPDANEYAWYLGYASGMTEHRAGNHVNGYDRQFQQAKDDFARGYSAGWKRQQELSV